MNKIDSIDKTAQYLIHALNIYGTLSAIVGLNNLSPLSLSSKF